MAEHLEVDTEEVQLQLAQDEKHYAPFPQEKKEKLNL
jgi:hypothetical protein